MGKVPRILCLHGHQGSAKLLEHELKQWPEFILEMMDLVCIDAPFPVESQFDFPQYEWFHANEDFTYFKNFDECIAYLEDRMVELGPFDGVLGMSQGGILAATLPGMQREGVALCKVPKIKFVILIGSAKFGGSKFPGVPALAKNAFSSPVNTPSLHIIGEKDSWVYQFELMDAFVNPMLLFHHEGHVVPHLDKNGVKIMLEFLNKIHGILEEEGEVIDDEAKKSCSSCLASLICIQGNWWNKKRKAQINDMA